MAAPTPSTRSTPSGFKMPDGYRTLISFASNTSIQFWERQVKPPGFDGGDGIDTTTMHNSTYRTKDARHLKTLTEATCMAAYDPDVFPAILSIINVPQSVTVHFPDGSSLCFYGFLQKFEAGELKEGEFPEATIQITPTNWDPSAFTEAAPVFTPAAGT